MNTNLTLHKAEPVILVDVRLVLAALWHPCIVPHSTTEQPRMPHLSHNAAAPPFLCLTGLPDYGLTQTTPIPHPFPQAEALGMETRNVSSAYLQPVLTRAGGYGASHTALAIGGAYHDPLSSSPSAISQNLSPKALTAMRTTRALKSLGQKVIFSNDPYVNSAVESLLTTRVQGLPPDIAPELAELISRKPPSGRLRPKGSKARALERAKRMIGASAAPNAEVPFYDSVRVCDLERDRQAMPALLKAYVFNKQRVPVTKLEEYCEVLAKLRPAPMLQAAALLMQAGYFFAAIKVRARRGPHAVVGVERARTPGDVQRGASGALLL